MLLYYFSIVKVVPYPAPGRRTHKKSMIYIYIYIYLYDDRECRAARCRGCRRVHRTGGEHVHSRLALIPNNVHWHLYLVAPGHLVYSFIWGSLVCKQSVIFAPVCGVPWPLPAVLASGQAGFHVAQTLFFLRFMACPRRRHAFGALLCKIDALAAVWDACVLHTT